MSSSGIDAINSGPLILRTYNNSSPNKSIVLGTYDIPVSSNYILITSSGGLLAPSDNIYLSSLNVSTFYANSTFTEYAFVSSLFASSIIANSITTSTISSAVGSVIDLTVSSINGIAFTSSSLPLWATDGGANIYNTNIGNVGIGINTATTKLQVVGDFSTLGSNILIGDTYIQGSTQITNYLSTNNIKMNSGFIENTGQLRISTSGLINVTGPNDGTAGIRLMNEKSRIVTNNTFDGMFFQVSTIAPNFFFTSLLDTERYAYITSTFHQFNNKCEVVAPASISSYEHYLNITNYYNGPAVTSDVYSALILTTTLGFYKWTLTNQEILPPTGRIEQHLQLFAYDFPLIGGGTNNKQIIDFAPTGNTILYGSLNISSAYSNIGNLFVEGGAAISSFVSTPTIYMSTNGINQGQITGLSSINGVMYPPPVAGEVPIGGIIMWSGTSVTLPTNWSLCDGGIYNSVQTPDLRGRFIMGATYANGTNYYSGMATTSTSFDSQPVPQRCPALAVSTIGGEINHTLTIAEMPSHNHGYFTAGAPNNQYQFVVAGTGANYTLYSPTGVSTSNTGGSGLHNNMPQYYVLAYIMRTT